MPDRAVGMARVLRRLKLAGMLSTFSFLLEVVVVIIPAVAATTTTTTKNP
jgi:hypothetical protein